MFRVIIGIVPFVCSPYSKVFIKTHLAVGTDMTGLASSVHIHVLWKVLRCSSNYHILPVTSWWKEQRAPPLNF